MRIIAEMGLQLDLFDSKSVKERFSKRAEGYHQLNSVQKRVAYDLVSHIASKPKRILDLGSGSGAIYNAINWEVERFIAVDFSETMLELHPKNSTITTVQADFNSESQMRDLAKYKPFSLVISASALQWSEDLAKTLDLIKELHSEIAIALFCDKTFQNLREFADLSSNLPSKDVALDLINSRFDVVSFTKEYELEFKTPKELLGYISKSGVGGGFKRLAFSKARNLMECYPHCTLRFEALFAISKNHYI